MPIVASNKERHMRAVVYKGPKRTRP